MANLAPKATLELVEADAETVESLRQKLLDPNTSLPEKYRVMFSLRNVAGHAAHEALLTALKDNSALFRHDVAFCLGQRQDTAAIARLKAILHDAQEHPMVRHEAGEALGAIGTEECLQPLREHLEDPVLEVAETCQLGLQRIQDLARRAAEQAAAPVQDESPYYSVDPTPALPASTPTAELKAKLLDESQPMFERYRALFGLRNKGGREAVEALGEAFKCRSALLKHEIAYVMGQMQDPTSTAILTDVLKDGAQAAMVRHEAAEALGAIADMKTIQLLKDYANCEEPIVADSCMVALDMLEFEASGAFEYADKGSGEQAAPAPRKACMC